MIVYCFSTSIAELGPVYVEKCNQRNQRNHKQEAAPRNIKQDHKRQEQYTHKDNEPWEYSSLERGILINEEQNR
jgi:hypothetical protein